MLKNTGDEIAGATGTDVTLRAERKLGGSAEALAPHTLRSVFIAFGGPPGAMVTPLKTRFGLLKNTGDEIAGATGTDVTLRAERKLGSSAKALAPHTLRSVFIPFGGPLRAMVTPLKTRFGLLKNTGDEIAGATGTDVTAPRRAEARRRRRSAGPTYPAQRLHFDLAARRAMVTPFRSRL